MTSCNLDPVPPDITEASSPGPPRGPRYQMPTLLTTHATNPDPASNSSCSSIKTLEPFELETTSGKVIQANSSSQVKGTGNSVYLDSIPLNQNFDSIAKEFGRFGPVTEIRVKLASQKQTWETWITYSNQEDAHKVCQEILNKVENVKCLLVKKPPANLDTYRPTEWIEIDSNRVGKLERKPSPPEWLIATTQGDHCNLKDEQTPPTPSWRHMYI